MQEWCEAIGNHLEAIETAPEVRKILYTAQDNLVKVLLEASRRCQNSRCVAMFRRIWGKVRPDEITKRQIMKRIDRINRTLVVPASPQ